MRVVRLSLVATIFFVILFVAKPARPGGQSAPPSISAAQLLQQSLAALQGNTPITDVTLSGSARRIAGSDDESGTATFKALSSGAASMDLSLPSGPRSELANLAATPPAGSWSGPDGVSHPIAFHNLQGQADWFFSAYAIARRLSDPTYVAAYIGQETLNAQSVHHISTSQTSSTRFITSDPLLPHLTQFDFFLDSTTLLPTAISFNTHPDNNELLDIPVKILFSDYRSVNGAQVPFHIQKFFNNALLLDLQFQTAALNTGLTAAQVGAQ